MYADICPLDSHLSPPTFCAPPASLDPLVTNNLLSLNISRSLDTELP